MSDYPRKKRKGKVLKAHPVIPEPVRALVCAPSLQIAAGFADDHGWTADQWRYIRKPADFQGLPVTGAPKHLVVPPGTRMDNDGWKAWEALTEAHSAADVKEEDGLF